MSDIQQRASFDLIRYASCWEDADILLDALGVSPGAACLSIASGGDNSLALLACAPGLVVAADLSAAQLAVVELKRAAMGELEYEEFLRFLGFRESPGGRGAIYRTLREKLSLSAREFWDSNEPIVERGIIHAGKFERYFHLFRRRIMPLIHSRRTIARLLDEKSFEERVRFYREEWDNLRWRLIFRVFFSRTVLGSMGRDPEFFRYVEGSVAGRILKRVEYALTVLPVHDNPYVAYILTGSFGDALPFYARRENFDPIRANLDRLHLHHGTAQSAAAAHGVQFDACNLSDIFEYMDGDTFRQSSLELVGSCSPGARLAYWNMLVPRRVSEILPDRVERMEELSERLFLRDRAFFYQSFLVERVTG